MATIDDVSRIARSLPDVVEAPRGGQSKGLHWAVGGKTLAWEREFSKADVRRFGEDPVPAGPIVAVVVEDLGEKQAVLEAAHPGFFTIPHFEGHAAVLIQLDAVKEEHLREAVTDAWLAVAPEHLARDFLAER
ncbi:MAG: hypothetical protein FWF90_07725 [Promicromonosporaceae bacterium]|nr:hypothetical protein [Promicromonosporaceae bacterium]